MLPWVALVTGWTQSRTGGFPACGTILPGAGPPAELRGGGGLRVGGEGASGPRAGVFPPHPGRPPVGRAVGAQQRGVCAACPQQHRRKACARGLGARVCCREGPAQRDGQGTSVRGHGDSQDSGSSAFHPRGVLCDCTLHMPGRQGQGRAEGSRGLGTWSLWPALGPVMTPAPLCGPLSLNTSAPAWQGDYPPSAPGGPKAPSRLLLPDPAPPRGLSFQSPLCLLSWDRPRLGSPG